MLYSRASEQNEYFCEKCGQIFERDVNALMMHIDAVHSKKGKSQNLPMATTVRPYLCEVCGKGYTQSSHLYQHLRFHKGESTDGFQSMHLLRAFVTNEILIEKTHSI